ncbi:thioesterase family protein [Aliihoeflea sp. 2WW]|uniref:thioesterase family protein n=1 Tax=Aliihoeflea sp. 2WW TaxID=1381123 RepID=UPI0004665493|nr:thioesterase family protein [Aliihoeflea sp. 2WW]
MYVWGRLARMVATAKSRGPFRPGDESRLKFRCLPSDIDRNMHLNNARYMMLADVGRVDIFLRLGFLKLARERGWGPMMGGLQSVYVREIKLWQRFEVVTTVETWTDRHLIGRHRFLHDDGRTAAVIMTTAGVYDRNNRRFVPIDELIAELGIEATPRPLLPQEEAFLASHQGLRDLAKSSH